MFNKEEFIAAYAEKAEITKAEAGRRIEEICGVWLENATRALAEDPSSRVHFGPLFTVTSKMSSARTGRNPRTGEPIQIAAKRRLKVVPQASVKRVLEETA